MQETSSSSSAVAYLYSSPWQQQVVRFRERERDGGYGNVSRKIRLGSVGEFNAGRRRLEEFVSAI